jgi:hypothetical protein
MKSAVTFVLLSVLVASAAAALTPSAVQAAAPDPHIPALGPHICKLLGGTWTPGKPFSTLTNICFISSSAEVTSSIGSFQILSKTTLYLESGSLTIDDGITVTNNGLITSYGTITVNSGGTITNNGEIDSSGTITNNAGGTINNNSGGAGIYNSGTINNNSGGTVNNAGTINNSGTINNYGTWNTSGSGSCTNTGPGTGCP